MWVLKPDQTLFFSRPNDKEKKEVRQCETKSEQHPIIVIDETEDPSNVFNQEPEQHQLINASEDPNKDEGELYGCIAVDEIDDEDIFAALVQASKSPSPCFTPAMVHSSDDDNNET